MKTKEILSWLLLLFGEAIIIAAFILFRGDTPDNILILNIVVSTALYGVIFLNYRGPWIDLKEGTQKRIGALGISWFVTWFYAIPAIAVMICGNLVFDLAFISQLIIHCVLLFLLLSGMLASRHSSDRVKNVYIQETANRNGMEGMKTAMRDLKDRMNDAGHLPENFMQRIDLLEADLRFIAPANSREASVSEDSFVKIVNEIASALADYAMNEERIEGHLRKLERIHQNRKSVYSN